ncbi:uncharacterized protein TRAVEDRAFT_50354 [Trametes versicolor FP-101664 SS1]|uniref:uncharacterized protein n=1 Tax=Trametes versicolor (strain FP-101664) TaxID=717944 RepID=UPI00046236CB|nr:uncharacterized protein TRAVEDRAFT_50354 [Trametes versicolor FP-101664 SS1]EIW55868.1 hypothetical protein TRAVEDRAFT_50354 [Trametes versicolor FP-101664 SS1]
MPAGCLGHTPEADASCRTRVSHPARRIPGHAMHAPKTIMSMTTSASFVPQDIPSPPRRDYHVASAIRRAYRAVVTFSGIRGTYDSLRRTAVKRHRNGNGTEA